MLPGFLGGGCFACRLYLCTVLRLSFSSLKFCNILKTLVGVLQWCLLHKWCVWGCTYLSWETTFWRGWPISWPSMVLRFRPLDLCILSLLRQVIWWIPGYGHGSQKTLWPLDVRRPVRITRTSMTRSRFSMERLHKWPACVDYRETFTHHEMFICRLVPCTAQPVTDTDKLWIQMHWQWTDRWWKSYW